MTAIRVQGVGKRFTLGESRPSFPTLRDALTSSTRRVGRLLQLGFRSSVRPRPLETFWALRDVSFDVDEGDVIGIIGGNGAGKSTLLKVLSRITGPTEGKVEIKGRVGSLLEVGTGFHPELSGRENMFLNGAILGMTRREVAKKFDEIVAFAEVERFIDTPVKRYSSGMYLRLAFAVAAHLEPEILIVDEVLAVGDVAFQKKCLGKMGTVAREGRTVLFVSHNLVAVESLCTRAIRLRAGCAVDSGIPGDVISHYLRENTSQLTDREWTDPATAPGNDLARIRRAVVRPERGTSRDTIDVHTPFVMEFEYWNFEPGARLNLSLHLYNEQGILVFNAGPGDEPRGFSRGLYRDVCHVPGGLLNDGAYTAELLIVRNEHIVAYKHSELLSFEIQDSVEGRGHRHGDWAGVVRPQGGWHTTQVETGTPHA